MPGAYEIAQSWSGTKEGDAALNDFLYNGGQNLDAKTRAWCSDFVKAAASKSGITTNATGMARSWLDEGQPVDQPQPGDVAVFSRGSDPSSGHVGFYEGTNPDGTIKVLSGNHGDAAASGNYPASRLIGYRRLGPGNDPRNVAMNGGQSGVDPDGFAGVSGAIHTQTPGDAGVPFAPKPIAPAPGMPATQVAGAFKSPMASLGKSVGAFADALGGGGKEESNAFAQMEKANQAALGESEREAQAAIDLVRKRPKLRMKPTMGVGAFG